MLFIVNCIKFQFTASRHTQGTHPFGFQMLKFGTKQVDKGQIFTMKRKTKLMFQALALLQSEKPTLKTSTLLSLHGGNFPLISLFDTNF